MSRVSTIFRPRMAAGLAALAAAALCGPGAGAAASELHNAAGPGAPPAFVDRLSGFGAAVAGAARWLHARLAEGPSGVVVAILVLGVLVVGAVAGMRAVGRYLCGPAGPRLPRRHRDGHLAAS